MKCVHCKQNLNLDGYRGPVSDHVLWRLPDGKRAAQCLECYVKHEVPGNWEYCQIVGEVSEPTKQ